MTSSQAVDGLRGRAILERPLLNKGTTLTEEEQERLGLVGLLPSAVLTLEQQAKRAYEQYHKQPFAWGGRCKRRVRIAIQARHAKV